MGHVRPGPKCLLHPSAGDPTCSLGWQVRGPQALALGSIWVGPRTGTPCFPFYNGITPVTVTTGGCQGLPLPHRPLRTAGPLSPATSGCPLSGKEEDSRPLSQGPVWPSGRLRPYQGPGLFPAVLQGCCRTGQAGPQSGPFPKDSGSWELWGKVHLAKVWKMKQQPRDRPASVSFGLFYSATPFLEQSSALVTSPSSAVKGARVAAGRSEVRAAGWAGPQTLRRRRQHLQGGAGRPHSAQESWESQQVEVERSL